MEEIISASREPVTLNVVPVPVTQVSYERVFIAQYTAPDIHLSPSSSRGSVGPATLLTVDTQCQCV